MKRRHPTIRAGTAIRTTCRPREVGPAAAQEIADKGAFAAGAFMFEVVEHSFVSQLRGARCIRAFLHLVIDFTHECVGGDFVFAGEKKRFDLANKLWMARLEDRALAEELFLSPAENIAQETGRLI
ncbi:MAG TPA: hypothetical protein DCG06_13320, partial [Deltaproteobacteria bacterium]|nr:hypothetical protein [Deltaproteobacteria bacterium]